MKSSLIDAQIKQILDETLLGRSTALYPENTLHINKVANDLYENQNLDNNGVETLKTIILICNILYNRTDVAVPPIEDGFYDLLLEKYKTYDPNFQVGSAVIDMQESFDQSLDVNTKKAQPAIVFFDDPKPPPDDEVRNYIYKNIGGLQPITKQDLVTCPIYFLQDNITKRQHNTEHNHPELVGTLDKTKFIFNQDAINAGVFDDPNVKILERDFFGAHIKKGIINPNDDIAIVCELKYDGISVEADCGTSVISARTRGDTGIGVAADITPILYGYLFTHARPYMENEEPLGVKFEAIMTKSNLERFNQLRGKNYSNCRTAIVGLFGASDAYLFQDLITLVPLAVDRKQIPQLSNRLEEIEFLNKVFVSDREPLRYCYFCGPVNQLLYLIKAFHDEACVLRDKLDFMYDGIVVSYLDEGIRNQLGRINYINKYSIAVKFNPIEKITTFRGYTFEVGKTGAICPMIHYDTVEFMGTLHNKSSGASYARFQELALKPGDFISVKYVNDVMPYVSRLECEHNRNNPNPVVPFTETCPSCGAKIQITPTGKAAFCTNPDCPERALQRMVSMFQFLNIKGFADAAFKVIGCTHLNQIVQLSEDFLIQAIGEANGKAFYRAIQSILNDLWNDFDMLGCLGFTGIARKKWQKILSRITANDLLNMYYQSPNQLYTILVDAVGEKTAEIIIQEFPIFAPDIQFIVDHIHIRDSIGSNNQDRIQIRFSGCRNQQLIQQLSTTVDIDDGSITKSTNILLVPYLGFESSKVDKAKKYGASIIPIQDFIANQDEILNSLATGGIES